MTYIDRLSDAIRRLHGCESVHVSTTPVREIFRGQVAWEGNVELFTITGHPKAKHCYAWGYHDLGKWHITTALELPPVESAQTAVKVAIAAAAASASPATAPQS